METNELSWDYEVEARPFQELYMPDGTKVKAQGTGIFVPELNCAIEHNSPGFELITNKEVYEAIVRDMGEPVDEKHHLSKNGLRWDCLLKFAPHSKVGDVAPLVHLFNSYTELNLIRRANLLLEKLDCSNGMATNLTSSTIAIRSPETLEDNFKFGTEILNEQWEIIQNMKEYPVTNKLITEIKETFENNASIKSIYNNSQDTFLAQLARGNVKNLFDIYMEFTNYVSHNPNTNWRTKNVQTTALAFMFGFMQN